MEKITKHNAYKVANRVHKYLHNKYGNISRVSYKFCGSCQNEISLFVFCKSDTSNQFNTLEIRGKVENLIRQLISREFGIDSEIFFMQ